MVAVTARTEFATYVDGDCVSVTSGQTFDVPQERADALVAGGLADFVRPATTRPPETKPAGDSPEVKVVQVPEVKAHEPDDGDDSGDESAGKKPAARKGKPTQRRR